VVLTVRCPAKINTFLAVGPVDARGYHPLRTIFQAIDLVDELVISDETDRHEFICTSPDVPADNTVTKALRLAAELVQVPPLRVELRKNIPSEAGLGGGSSDAAGMLRAIARFTDGYAWGHAEMVAQAVGADVSFFLVGGRARAEGYGERLTPLPDAATEWYVVAQPEDRVNTGAAYAQLDAKPYTWRDWPVDERELYNDFERVAPCGCLELTETLQSLGADGALLSGSGSAVFGRFGTESAARAACDQLDVPFKAVVRSLTREESLWM
jgi:4-diphosphocytidyl-2-C-methyl-D-erythritol kinase